jgi:hypothetical protein
MAKHFLPDPEFKLELERVEATTKRDEKSYRSSLALNQSLLKGILSVSPSHAEYLRLNPEETPALTFGSALHTLVLEPNEFNKRYAVLPECDRRTKEGKAIYEDFCLSNAGKTVLRNDDYIKLVSMAAKSRPFFDEKQAIKSFHEMTFSGTYAVTDGQFKGKRVEVKAMFDAVYQFEDRVVIKDLKSVGDISNVTGASYGFGWAVQSAFYHDLGQFLYRKDVSFDYVAQSKEEPYDVREYAVSDEMFAKGRASYYSAINRWLWWDANGRPDTAEFLGKQTLNG